MTNTMNELPRLRTPDEIAARVKYTRADDFFGWKAEVLLPYLPFDLAKPYLKEGVTSDQWDPSPLHVESVLKEMLDYLAFAFGKAYDERGISANRSIEKLTEWLWVLGMERTLAAFEAAPYPEYGLPQLRVLAAAVGAEDPGR